MLKSVGSKYAAFVRISFTHAWHERGDLYGRAGFLVVVLGLLSSLWRVTGGTGLIAGTGPKALAWYVAITEWIVLSSPLIHQDIQEAVRRGDIVYQLGRPLSFVGATFAEAVGVLAVRAPLLGIVAFLCAFAFTGWIPPLRGLSLVVPFGLVASTLLTALDVGIGLMAFWLDDVSPLYWVWQKLLFVCGGLMLPIQVYPAAIQRVAAFTPFPSILAGPASFVLDGQAFAPLLLARDLVAWGAVTAVIVCMVFKRATDALAINGG